MSQLFESPPETPAGYDFTRRRRRLFPIFLKQESRSIEIGIAATILIHLILFLLAPRLLETTSATALQFHKKPPVKQFKIQLMPRYQLRPPPKKFVETNPYANHNIPKNTNNIGAQNQTAAQEKPNPKGTSDRAATEGRKNFQSTQVVTGDLRDQMPSPPAPTAPNHPAKTTKAPKQALNPLPGFQKTQGQNQNAYGMDIAPQMDQQKISDQRQKGAAQPQDQAQADADYPTIDPRHPQPRQTLSQRVRPAIFAENKVGTSNIGLSGVDARWDPWAEYLQRMVDAIQIEWYRVLDASHANPPVGTTVSIKFRLDSRGRVAEILNVDNSSNEQGKDACLSALTNRSPYGEWTKEMIATLGDSQEMTFTFFYVGE